jgi:queuosine precursor transporter
MSSITNELLLLCMALVCAAFVFLSWRLDRERLHGVILIFLILISLTGSKVVEFFGHPTNTGNIFYASVFLATYFLIERYGKREGIHAIWVGTIGMVFFMVLARLSIMFTGSDSTAQFNEALHLSLAPAFRIAVASVIAFLVSQTINVLMYNYLKANMEHIGLWLRANATNLLAQIVDSVIFFTIAFAGVVGEPDLVDVILTGLTIKVLFMAAAAPLLYLNGYEEDTEHNYTTISWKR